MQDELLHAPVQDFGDEQHILGRARHLVDPAELLELLARLPKDASAAWIINSPAVPRCKRPASSCTTLNGTIAANTNYSIDLKIDDTVTTSTYTWYKNGILFKTIKGSNKLPFTPFTSNDAGTYIVKITNPLAPQLILESWPIRLVSKSSKSVVIIDPKSFCSGDGPYVPGAAISGFTSTELLGSAKSLSGPGIVRDTFFPSIAGTGNHIIRFTLKTKDSLIYTDTSTFIVGAGSATILNDKAFECAPESKQIFNIKFQCDFIQSFCNHTCASFRTQPGARREPPRADEVPTFVCTKDLSPALLANSSTFSFFIRAPQAACRSTDLVKLAKGSHP